MDPIVVQIWHVFIYKDILEGKTTQFLCNGKMERGFAYIEDIVAN